MTPQEKALTDWKKNNPRRKGNEKYYADGRPRVEGKTKAQAKTEAREAYLNRDKSKDFHYPANYSPRSGLSKSQINHIERSSQQRITSYEKENKNRPTGYR